ncbi:Vinorine synthase [Morella rubra]|uniref:Vinorine synthase n=1 Tax=Morella rubra TaxID=262757 RepID=A0A6A1UMQ9_9ROSI|nr:Vinorine synthase [Morella rubra]
MKDVYVEVVSKDTIKPSSSTPDHLRPGRIKGNSHVDCNDEGVLYVEAKATCTLSEFLEDPEPGETSKFLPFELDDVNELAFAVQVTTFSCGGIVIGLVFAHKVADASSFFMFLNSWAAIGRGSSDITTPRFEAATIFPPETFPSYTPSRGLRKKNKIAVKRFVFESSAIAALRAKYSTEDMSVEYPRPTRVEALSAFVFNRYLAATEAAADPNKVCTVFHIANLRSRVDPPHLENYFGNMSMPTGTVISRDTENGFQGIISPVRDALKKVDMNHVKCFRESGAYLKFMTDSAERFKRSEVVSLAFTSLCRFPAYEADFGWGKPVWIGSCRLLYQNLVTFFDTKSGDGIEVLINLDEEEMAKFEADKELLDHISSAKVSAN